jgi:hypothetical protein
MVFAALAHIENHEAVARLSPAFDFVAYSVFAATSDYGETLDWHPLVCIAH